MTRQKKELEKQIEQIEQYIAAEEEMGCGFTPVDWFRPLEEQIWKIQEQLAKLRHYSSVEEMLWDNRGFELGNLPFI